MSLSSITPLRCLVADAEAAKARARASAGAFSWMMSLDDLCQLAYRKCQASSHPQTPSPHTLLAVRRHSKARRLSIMRSKFFTECDSTDAEDAVAPDCPVKEQIYEFCKQVAKDLGGGHSEAVYEQALLRRLYNAKTPVLRQVQWFSKTNSGDLLSVGFADLEVDHSFIVELKIGPKIKPEHITQLNRYLRAAQKMGSPIRAGAVVCFQTTESGEACNVLVHESFS